MLSKTSTPLILNLGCGNHKADDEIGVDIIKTEKTDIVCDISKGKLPFMDGSIDIIRSRHSFEHVDDVVSLMSEMYRLLKHNGILEATVPHVSNIDFFRDPTHKTFFTYGTFDYFVEGMKPIEYSNVRFRYMEKKLIFSKGLRPRIGRFIFRLSPRKYEKYYCWNYPCYEIFVKLQAIKS